MGVWIFATALSLSTPENDPKAIVPQEYWVGVALPKKTKFNNRLNPNNHNILN